MATTVLECDDFATIVLDTEGIDAVGASETMAMSLLTLTTLLSSFLIYNSKKVHQKVDLNKMRCFSQLSASLLSQCGDSTSTALRRACFPNFLWLLRDVSLKMTDREGKELRPTEFLHTRVLASESGELTELGKSLVGLFPSLECATLPIPSTKRDIIRGIVEQQDKLKPAFNTAVNALIQQILQKLAPKKGGGWYYYSDREGSGCSSRRLCGGSQQARSSTRPEPGVAGCGETGAEGRLLQAGEGVREGNGGGFGGKPTDGREKSPENPHTDIEREKKCFEG